MSDEIEPLVAPGVVLTRRVPTTSRQLSLRTVFRTAFH